MFIDTLGSELQMYVGVEHGSPKGGYSIHRCIEVRPCDPRDRGKGMDLSRVRIVTWRTPISPG